MKTLFNDDWKFYKSPLFASKEEILADESRFTPVELPHDWLVHDTKNLYEDSAGWYLKNFEKPDIPEGGHVFLYFDGVYMDSEVFVNDEKVGEWKYGYSSFFFEITEALREGRNRVLVVARNQSPNTRWYSGAGIYRNVYMIVKPADHFVIDGIYVHSEAKKLYDGKGDFDLTVRGEIFTQNLDLSYRISLFENDKNSKMVASLTGTTQHLGEVNFSTTVEKASLWDISSPNLYKCRLELISGEKVLDAEEFNIGFKKVEMIPDKGLFLNGRKIKLNGTCEHHDLGIIGAVVNKEGSARRLRKLKKMGVNAIRTSHNMPSPELLDLCDEMGFLTMIESFDMWEGAKTKYDYARFFKEWSAKDVKSWICRDRNRACLLMWSIGNEIGDTHASAHGQEITRYLMNEVHKHDPLHNGPVTIGSNYMPWENAQKCADILKIAGYNYAERLYDMHHEEHPDWVIYGSETASLVASRGVYRFPYDRKVMSEVDEQCSALGNSNTSWGAKSVESCIIAERDHDFSMGQFLWTGFDYIGEPTPYHTKNSYFGQFDTAGFPKDGTYIFASEWTKPEDGVVLHIFPYWDWNEGQKIDVRVTSNCRFVELFVNGKSEGVKEIDHEHGDVLVPTWTVDYHKGEVRAVAYDKDMNKVAECTEHSFTDSVKTVAVCEDNDNTFIEKTDENSECTLVIPQDGREIYFVDISMLDNDGFEVKNAMDHVTVTVSENAKLLGLDNGDSTDYDQYESCFRKLFNGKLMAMVKSVGAGDIRVNVKRSEEKVSARKIELKSDTLTLTPGMNDILVTAEVFPKKAVCELTWAAVNKTGIEMSCIKVIGNGDHATVSAIGDADFTLRCYAKENGRVTLISQIEMKAEGFGEAFLSPYEFVSAGLYTDALGEIGCGNEKGVATSATEKSGFVLSNIDFGDYGSDEFTIWIFALSGENFPFEVYDGNPEKGGRYLATFDYKKPCIWDVYQEETYRLPERLKGVHDLCFMATDRLQFKGFRFKKYNKAYEELDCSFLSSVTGDSFRRTDTQVLDIGNNVTLTFDNVDLSESASKIRILGKTDLDKCSIHLHLESEAGTKTEILEFTAKDKGYMDFDLDCLRGCGKLEFIFLPGSRFDFYGFRFTR
ncbi:MAG: DUF4982 domain-containing protein [Lachnospiraceae bacterium]|nr:DUF4982 domain-containing protein [Lachnospiraceae bacterium]